MGRRSKRYTAAGIIIKDGCILLEKRRPGPKPSAGLWDTPGGHLKPEEAPQEALVRELDEELGIIVSRFQLGLVQEEHEGNTGLDYRHHIFIIQKWRGNVFAREGQHLEWLPLPSVLDLDGLNPLLAQTLGLFMKQGALPE